MGRSRSRSAFRWRSVTQCAQAFAGAGWRGPLNIQCQQDTQGTPLIHEFNGRFTGATVDRWLLGFDEVGAAIESLHRRGYRPRSRCPSRGARGVRVARGARRRSARRRGTRARPRVEARTMSAGSPLRVAIGGAEERLPDWLSMGWQPGADVPFRPGEEFPFEDRAIDGIECGEFVHALDRADNDCSSCSSVAGLCSPGARSTSRRGYRSESRRLRDDRRSGPCLAAWSGSSPRRASVRQA